MINIHYIRQKEPKGLGHAISCARSFIGDEPFAVILGDDIVVSEEPCLKQLMDVYESHPNSSIIGVQEVNRADVSKYGIVDPNEQLEDHLYSINTLVEKPSIEEAPSNLAIQGRYILQPEIFSILETIEPGAGDEIQLTDALRKLSEKQRLLAYFFEGNRYDVGDKLGFIKATLELGLKREGLKEDLLIYLEELMDRQKGK